MKQFKFLVTDSVGIHARPAGLLVKSASRFSCMLTMKKSDGKSANLKKLFNVMGMGVKSGDYVTVIAEGEDEDAAIQQIKTVFEDNL